MQPIGVLARTALLCVLLIGQPAARAAPPEHALIKAMAEELDHSIASVRHVDLVDDDEKGPIVKAPHAR